MSTNRALPRFDLKGVPVAAVDLDFAGNLLGQCAAGSTGQYVAVTGAHGIVESAYSQRILAAHQAAFMVVPDGMPLVWLGRFLGFKSMTRVYGPDLMQVIFANAKYRALRHFFYGANPAVIDKLSESLRARFGQFNLVGSYSPPIRPLGFCEEEDVLVRIRELRPDFIWVGLSTPKQELWMHMHMPKIGCGIAIGVGAAFDFLAGTSAQAPRWIQRSGLEWLFRLSTNPRRLYRRYLFVVPKFLQFSLLELMKYHTVRRQKGTV